MYLLVAVASLCGVALIASLVSLACRHRGDLWITSDTSILCVVSPAMILLLTFGGVSIGYRMTHGGFSAIPIAGWIGSAILLAASAGLWILLARWIRRGRPGTPSPA